MSNGQKQNAAAPGLRGLKNARYAQVAVILVAVLAVWAVFVVLLSGDGKKPKAQSAATDPGKIAVKAITAPGEVVTDAQRWLYKAGDDITALKGNVQESMALNKTLQARIDTLEAEAKNQAAASAATPAASPAVKTFDFPPGTPSNPAGSGSQSGSLMPKFIPPPVSPISNANASVSANPTQSTQATVAPVPPPPRIGIGRVSVMGATPGQSSSAVGAKSTATKPSMGQGSPSAPSISVAIGSNQGSNQGSQQGSIQGQPESAQVSSKNRSAGVSFLPIGLVKAKLIGGIDAPTAGAAQSSPMPVFLRLDDLAWLPNHWRANVKDCLVTAAGYGDLSSERAYFRLEKLSCVRHDGRVLEQNVSGAIYGEDGKLGMRGRLVTKQGQILANALLAGVVSGIGRGVVYQSSSVGTTALGTVVTDPDPGKEYQSGIGQGVSNAMDRLAQYYISLADKTHPIIEIDAGRAVDLGFTKGSALDVPLPEDADLLAMRSGSRSGQRRVVE